MVFQFQGLSDSDLKDLLDELRTGWAMERVKTEICQRQTAQVQHEARAMNGLGRLRMVVDPVSWAFWRLKEGPHIWKDKNFKRAFERDNDSVRVKCRGTRVQVGYQ